MQSYIGPWTENKTLIEKRFLEQHELMVYVYDHFESSVFYSNVNYNTQSINRQVVVTDRSGEG